MLREVNRPALVGLIAAGALIGGLALTGGRSQAGTGTHPEKRTAQAARPSPVEELKVEATPFERYKPLLERNPFAPKLPKPEAGVKSAPALPPAGDGKKDEVKKPDEGKKDATKPPEPADPLKDWLFTGVVAIGDQVYAVMENKPSKQSRYVKQGEQLQGAAVQVIGDNELLLMLNGQPRRMSKSTAFAATPLNASAGGGPAGGAGAPGGNPGGPNGPGGSGNQGGPGGPGGAKGPAGAPAGGPAGRKVSPAPAAPPSASATIVDTPVAGPAPQ